MKKNGTKIHLNIGIVIFSIIFVYLCISLIVFASRKHVDTYQVTEGPLSSNESYSALILRDEAVVNATASGFVNYLVNDNSKAAAKQNVCVITTDKTDAGQITINDAQRQSIREITASKLSGFTKSDFYKAYDLQNELNTTLRTSNFTGTESGTYYSTDVDCLINYTTDGYETVTEDMVTADLINSSDCVYKKLNEQDEVEIGEPLFRQIKNEEWSIYFPLTDEQTVRLAAKDNLRVRFLDDGNTERGVVNFFLSGDARIAKITFTRGMVRYASKRYVDIEILSDEETGLKIPVTAITNKEFYLIPESFLVLDEDDNTGFNRLVTDSANKTSTEFVKASLFAQTEEDENGETMYYVDKNLFEEGDILINQLTGEKYKIELTDVLQGVYCVNKGYSVFRKIEIIDKNSEYCIVKKDTSYGLSLYDYIVRDATQVKEQDLVY